MSQTEATAKLSSTIYDGMYYGLNTGGSVTIGHPVDHDGPDVILVSYQNGLVLSVTVEILAQP